MTGLAIRPAAVADSATLVRLIAQLGYDVTADEIAGRPAVMEQEGRLVLVAEIEGNVVGCLSTSVMRVLHRPAPVGGPRSFPAFTEGIRSFYQQRNLAGGIPRSL